MLSFLMYGGLWFSECSFCRGVASDLYLVPIYSRFCKLFGVFWALVLFAWDLLMLVV